MLLSSQMNSLQAADPRPTASRHSLRQNVTLSDLINIFIYICCQSDGCVVMRGDSESAGAWCGVWCAESLLLPPITVTPSHQLRLLPVSDPPGSSPPPPHRQTNSNYLLFNLSVILQIVKVFSCPEQLNR